MITFGIGAVIGLTAGAISGFLLAPQSGQETQEELKNEAKKLQSKVLSQTSKAFEQGSEYVDQIDREYLRKNGLHGTSVKNDLSKDASLLEEDRVIEIQPTPIKNSRK